MKDTHSEPDGELARVEIIIDMQRLTPLLRRLDREGIASGVTVFQALGCGTQKGAYEYEEPSGAARELQLLPKTMLLIFCARAEVPKLVEIVKLQLYTGHIGDGKIFVSPLGNVIRVRTGDEGQAALSQAEVR